MNNLNINKRDFFELYNKTKKAHKQALKLNQKKNKAIKIFTIIAIMLITISLVIFAIFNYFFGNFKTDLKFKKNYENLGIKNMNRIDKKIYNIAIFGVDKRKNEKNGRSDTTMILTIDQTHNEIKLTNLMRDSLVKISGHGKQKLCHAFSYGGATLAIKTINQNFDLDIFDYITVNFAQMADVINVIDGLNLEITKREALEINGLLNSTPEFKNKKRINYFNQDLKNIHLTGEQVLQYCRIRGIDNDIKRVDRQQYVINLILEKIKKLNKTKYPLLIKTIFEKIETSLKVNEILKFIPFLLNLKSAKIQKCKIPNPEDKEVHSGTVQGLWCWIFDINKYTKILHKFIYEDKSKFKQKQKNITN